MKTTFALALLAAGADAATSAVTAALTRKDAVCSQEIKIQWTASTADSAATHITTIVMPSTFKYLSYSALTGAAVISANKDAQTLTKVEHDATGNKLKLTWVSGTGLQAGANHITVHGCQNADFDQKDFTVSSVASGDTSAVLGTASAIKAPFAAATLVATKPAFIKSGADIAFTLKGAADITTNKLWIAAEGVDFTGAKCKIGANAEAAVTDVVVPADANGNWGQAVCATLTATIKLTTTAADIKITGLKSATKVATRTMQVWNGAADTRTVGVQVKDITGQDAAATGAAATTTLSAAGLLLAASLYF